jgi:hypothetical protein
MPTKAASTNGLSGTEAGHLAALAGTLGEMAAARRSMKKTDAEIRRLRASSRRRPDETWAVIRRVQAAH